MSEIYPIADVGVVPSIFNDPFNLTMMEFCSNSIPVIISDRGAMKELVNDKCSVIAKCDENFADNILSCLEYIVDNKDRIDSMKTQALNVSTHYSIERYCQNFNNLLKIFNGE